MAFNIPYEWLQLDGVYLFYSKYSCFFSEDFQEENKFDDEKDDDNHDVDFQTKAVCVFVVGSALVSLNMTPLQWSCYIGFVSCHR